MLMFSTAFSALIMLPYLAWGIFTLRLRYRFHEELSFTAEVVTLAAVSAFLMLELYLLKSVMTENLVLYVFTVLGLAVSGAALYGPMLISVASQLFVDALMTHPTQKLDVANFAPVEALERIGDYEGAFNECLMLIRIFPKDPAASLRAGENLVQLERFEEATPWFERGLAGTPEADRALRIVNRLVEIYAKRLSRGDDAIRVLESHIALFPDSDRADTIRIRISKLAQPPREAAATATVLELEPREISLD